MSLIHRVLQYIMGRVARVVCAAPGVIVGVGVALAIASAVLVVLRFNVLNNTSDLLSAKYAPMQHYNELRKDFGSDYRSKTAPPRTTSGTGCRASNHRLRPYCRRSIFRA